jgi:hypothetical protein
MATQIVQSPVPAATVIASIYPPSCDPFRKEKPVLPPPGNVASGGPTAGQLFPVGNR